MLHAVYLISAWLAGLTVGALCIAQSITIVVFAIPFSRELYGAGVLRTRAPLLHYLVSLILLVGLLGLATWAMWRYFPGYFVAYAAGAIIPVVLGARSCGRNAATVREYFEVNSKYMNDGAFEAHEERSAPHDM